MKGNTAKYLQTLCDDVEAAEADVRSGKPELQIHGLTALIAITTEQASMIAGELGDYPEGKRMAAFMQKRLDDLHSAKALAESLLEKEREAEARREQWRKEAAEREAKRKEEEKARRAIERRDGAFLAAVAKEERVREQALAAEAKANQGVLFGDGGQSKEGTRE